MAGSGQDSDPACSGCLLCKAWIADAKTLTSMLAGQVLGRNLEALATRAQELKEQWRDQFVSVEHLVLALVDDARFGKRTLEAEGLTKAKLENAIKEMRGNNRVTDQVCFSCSCHVTVSCHICWACAHGLAGVSSALCSGHSQYRHLTDCMPWFSVQAYGKPLLMLGLCTWLGWDLASPVLRTCTKGA